MEIIYVPIGDLKPAEYNPRKMTEKQVRDLQESMKRFDLVEPIIVNKHPERANIIVGGHQRWHVAKILGYDKMPVVYVDLDFEKEKELNLRLNKNNGDFDFDMLANQFELDMLLDVGFSKEELDMFDPGDPDEDDGGGDPANATGTKVKPGDIYTLGDHRLMCGDSTSVSDVLALMDGEQARLIFTDPPYNVNYHAPGGLDYKSTKYGEGGGAIMNDNKSDSDFLDFCKKVLENLKVASTDDVTLYWWFANVNHHINRQALAETGWKFSQVLIWLKNSFVFSYGQDYHRRYEPCMLAWKEGKAHFHNRKVNNFQDVINLEFTDFEEMFDVWYERRDSTADYVHPTQKPVRLAGRAIRKSSQLGDIVLDLFGGSGSTLMACDQMGRKARLMELDPKYAEVILNRYMKATGNIPVRADGTLWTEVSG